eukprot:TRINITY_DN62540_c0_g1_i1.p1 TRINITY_DN62540_c0_g1~~TRINITY_DN62540_c0_g1_i1.p1  ORF type:complete len:861 (+),score=144.06 TRINITY_DN62540_c0_g1_i1:119-2701(+)
MKVSAGKIEKKLEQVNQSISELHAKYAEALAQVTAALQALEQRLEAVESVQETFEPRTWSNAPAATPATAALTALEQRLQALECAQLAVFVERENAENDAFEVTTWSDIPAAAAEIQEVSEAAAVKTADSKHASEATDALVILASQFSAPTKRFGSLYSGVAVAHDQHYEPVPFAESVWNLVLVVGFTGAAYTDIAISFFLFAMSTLMQLLFSYIVMTADFLGTGMDAHKADAHDWRIKVAHDHSHLNLAQMSLANRVCQSDSSLIVANGQADLVSMINAYLSLSTDPSHPAYFEAPLLSTGPMLCFVCIMLWTLYICQELRDNSLSVRAVLRIPISPQTDLEDMKLTSISLGRRACFLSLRALRAAISFCLLYAGIIWLSRTTSIQDLVLNAVALGAVLDIDNIVFSAMMPIKVQLAIQELEAVKIKYDKRRSQIEASGVFLFAVVVLLSALVFALLPLRAAMQDVKFEFCGGNQDFVVAENPLTQIVVSYQTHTQPPAATVLELAVEEAIHLDSVVDSKFLAGTETFDDFESRRSRSMAEEASQGVHEQEWACLQVNFSLEFISNLTGEWRALAERDLKLFNTVKQRLGMENASTCEDLANFCNSRENRLLRMICPETCGCMEAYGNRFYRTQTFGCKICARQIARKRSSHRTCNSMIRLPEGWHHFWDSWATNALVALGNIDENSSMYRDNILPVQLLMQKIGCEGLAGEGAKDLITGVAFCDGGPEFDSLRYFCPLHCRCQSAEFEAVCPQSCRKCEDAQDFPQAWKDARIDCNTVKAMNWCQDYPQEAMLYCYKTCGLCRCFDTEPEQFFTLEMQSVFNLSWGIESCTAISPGPGGQCEDEWMQSYCQETCETCA